MLHLSPVTGEIYIYELDPLNSVKYAQSIQVAKGEILSQVQIVDNLIVVHNIDDKSTNLYDIKLAEYNLPVCIDNLDIDTQYSQESYHSDKLFQEEKNENQESVDIENDNERVKSKE